MKIYHYHPETYKFIGEDVADPDPLDKGNWLIPANATDIEPLSEIEDMDICFIDGSWVYKEKPEEPKPYDPKEHWTYAEYRALEYPPVSDYIDGIVKGDQQQIDNYINKCLEVKQKYPKPD
jgi:hypothetical protein